MPRLFFLFALLLLAPIVGCDGCRSGSDDPTKTEENDKPLEDFSSPGRAEAFPAGVNVGGAIKPGHWFAASQSLRSNNEDARGQLESKIAVIPQSDGGSTSSDASIRTESNAGVSSHSTEMVSVRPTVLPQGQLRRFDCRVLAPNVSRGQQQLILSSRFILAGRTAGYDLPATRFATLSHEEFFFVILTTRPQRFAKFQVADWRSPLRVEWQLDSRAANYRIVVPSSDELLPLSETMLDWTSTAVVFWDDLSSDALTPGQYRALGDWLRFGGRLVVNGAIAAEAIANSPLADTLAISPRGNIELDADAAATLLKNWAVQSDSSTDAQIALLKSQSGRIALDGALSNHAQAVTQTQSLILTNRIGRGHLVQSRFDLTSDWLANWQSYGSFVNSVILNRPRRQLQRDEEEGGLRQLYVDSGMADATPPMNSSFRIAARDVAFADQTIDTSEPVNTISDRDGWVDRYTRLDPVSGLSGWNRSSDVLDLSREILRSESGIEIPDAELVIRSLGYYLLVLVPINFLVFWAIGRLEFAWLAVPVIAVVGAAWVAHVARLDIGFARSQTEIALLETQPGYPRGHLSRVVALYNSLSSQYDIRFKTVDAAASLVDQSKRDERQNLLQFRTDFEEGPILSGLMVRSNQTQMIRAEQIIDLGGSIDRLGDELINNSDFELLDALVVEKDSDSNLRVAIVGLVAEKSRVSLRFRPGVDLAVADDLPLQTSQFIKQLASPEIVPAGSARLVARIGQSIPGMELKPSSSQSVAQTILLAHLQHQPLATPQRDTNLPTDFKLALPLETDDLEEFTESED